MLLHRDLISVNLGIYFKVRRHLANLQSTVIVGAKSTPNVLFGI